MTGGASGIGFALCRLLAEAGMRIGVLDKNPEALSTMEQAWETSFPQLATVSADVRDRQAVQEAINTLQQKLGPADLVVACAGITGVTLLDDLTTERTENLIAINLIGPANTFEAVLKGMLDRGSGHIVGISSLVAVRGLPFTAAYCASKTGIANYLHGLRPQLAAKGVTVSVIYPGYVRTPLTEAGAVKPPIPMLEPEAAAQYILKAIKRKKRSYGFPAGLRFAMWLLCLLSPKRYDRTVSGGVKKIKHLKY